MNLHIAHDDVAGWASRPVSRSRSATARMLMSGAEQRTARDEVLIRLNGLRGSIEAIRTGAQADTLADTRTNRADIRFGSPACYRGLMFVFRS